MQPAFIPLSANRTGSRRIFKEIGESDLKMGGLCVQPFLHLFQNQAKLLQIKLAVKTVQNFNKPAHVCSLEPVRQVYIHVDRSNGLLEFFFTIQNGNRV